MKNKQPYPTQRTEVRAGYLFTVPLWPQNETAPHHVSGLRTTSSTRHLTPLSNSSSTLVALLSILTKLRMSIHIANSRFLSTIIKTATADSFPFEKKARILHFLGPVVAGSQLVFNQVEQRWREDCALWNANGVREDV